MAWCLDPSEDPFAGVQPGAVDRQIPEIDAQHLPFRLRGLDSLAAVDGGVVQDHHARAVAGPGVAQAGDEVCCALGEGAVHLRAGGGQGRYLQAPVKGQQALHPVPFAGVPRRVSAQGPQLLALAGGVRNAQGRGHGQGHRTGTKAVSQPKPLSNPCQALTTEDPNRGETYACQYPFSE